LSNCVTGSAVVSLWLTIGLSTTNASLDVLVFYIIDSGVGIALASIVWKGFPCITGVGKGCVIVTDISCGSVFFSLFLTINDSCNRTWVSFLGSDFKVTSFWFGALDYAGGSIVGLILFRGGRTRRVFFGSIDSFFIGGGGWGVGITTFVLITCISGYCTLSSDLDLFSISSLLGEPISTETVTGWTGCAIAYAPSLFFLSRIFLRSSSFKLLINYKWRYL
jgi:hypothetical protein